MDSVIAVLIQKYSMAIFFSAYYANLIMIGPVIPEITRAKPIPLWKDGKIGISY